MSPVYPLVPFGDHAACEPRRPQPLSQTCEVGSAGTRRTEGRTKGGPVKHARTVPQRHETQEGLCSYARS
jgi:hypothetical protein